MIRGPPSNGVVKASASSSKTATFYSSDEDEASATSTMHESSANGSRTHQNGGSKLKSKQHLADEAARLLSSRQTLPIWEGQAAILAAVAAHSTVILLGETGSGKTTQLPQFLLGSSVPCDRPRIAVTQPRRVAATSLAARVASEQGCELGKLVGYTVRFADMSSNATRLKYMTDGTLLAEMLGDRDLMRYDVVVLDEAHERSLRTDMLMGFLKQVQVRRREKVKAWKMSGKEGLGESERPPTELRIVVMSATLDAKRFSEFFDNAPVLYVKGRQYAVKIFYAEDHLSDYNDAALTTIYDIHLHQPPGDILVFLPGQEDIDNLSANIQAYVPDLVQRYPAKGEIMICPLYAKLPPSEQAKAFAPAPPKTRKVILATNVAETSVTITGVKYVVDTGMCKEKMYHPGIGIDSLSVQSISQSSARQRTGRAGRECDGKCYRLYTENSFLGLPLVSRPEIQRVSMTFAVLHLFASGQKNIWEFPYMDPPSKNSLEQALQTLHGLGAIDEQAALTPLGKQMSVFPLDPVYARVLLASFEEGCSKEIIDLVSLLGSRDSLLHSSASIREEANAARAQFIHRSGDHMMLLNVLKSFEEVEKREQKQWCRAHFVNFKALGTVMEARKQLKERCARLGLETEISCGDASEPVLSACLRGMFSNTALLQTDGTYRTTLTSEIISIHPSSILHNKKKPAIIYDELLFTAKKYARGVSSIEMQWLKSKSPAMFAQAPVGGVEAHMQ